MSDVLRLAVDARDLASDTRGIGRYARAILPRIAQRDDIELTLLVYAPLFRARRSQLSEALGTDGFRLATRAFGCDVMWHPGNGSFFLPSAANVVTIHDAGPFRFPQENPRKRRHQQEPFFRSARQAQRVIAVSNFGRAEVLDVLGIEPARIDVIYHGVDDIFTEGDPRPAQAMVERPYFIFVGDPIAEPRKNFSTLFDAYIAAFPDDQTRPLLVVLRPVRPALPGVRYVGPPAGSGPDDVHLRDLYRGALALCMPSYYEGFGMPLLEAMACGTPVISSDISSLPEIGGGAALYASPYDARAWSDVLQRVAGDEVLRSRLRGEGLEHVKAFSWERSAQRHAEIFHSL
ncbi:MAG TPA: glycosyltransferase family 1 protein [Candidatus Baltobacteraceae bacterium]|nr:glycosyltransferase family 1 protein [Candidatus Baltobacteraceae bacterium]